LRTSVPGVSALSLGAGLADLLDDQERLVAPDDDA
jgi:hypothetical protein